MHYKMKANETEIVVCLLAA